MSSTPAADAPTSIALPVSFNASSLSSVTLSYSNSHSASADTASILTLVTSPPPFTSAPVRSAFSKQSQQLSSAPRTTMSALATTVTLQSASSSAPLSIVTLTSASFSLIFSKAASSVVTLTNDSRPMTSTQESSVQPTTISVTTALRTTQSSTLTTLSTTIFRLTTSSAQFPAPASTSSAPIYTSSHLPPNPSFQGPSPGRSDTPLTTVLESTTIFVTSTNNEGQVMTSIPAVVTQVITTTGYGGIATTITQAIVNPTLAPNNSTNGNSSFFRNTGAVVGVFVVVGLATTSIMIWILFAIRHRQRMQRIEQDTAVEAIAAAAGLNRAPLDDDDQDDSPISPHIRNRLSSGVSERSRLFEFGQPASLPTSTRLSRVFNDLTKDSGSSHPGHSVEHHRHPEGYIPARTATPSPRAERCIDDFSSSRDRKSSYGHTPTYSAGSFEPLLANYVQNTAEQGTSAPTMQQPRNGSARRLGRNLVLSEYSSDGSPEDVTRTSFKRENSSDSSILPDEDDCTRSVLMVRNVPDNQSQHSS